MKRTFTQHWVLPPSWLRFLVIILLVLGVFFRFANLGLKVYWHDETITSLHLAGYTGEDVRQQLFNGSVMGVKELLKYQFPTPETSFGDTLRTLIIEDPQHPPIYYLITRLWMHVFGNSVAVIRSVSALISLFVFPCIYWVCIELFASSLVGWVAIALSAVSPVLLVFAQEARGYSLLMVVILLSSASLLRAMRVKTKGSWVIYAATLALGFYSLPLILLTAMGHGVYVVIVSLFSKAPPLLQENTLASKKLAIATDQSNDDTLPSASLESEELAIANPPASPLQASGFPWSKIITNYLLASLTAFLAFTPWVLLTFNSLQKAQASTAWSSTQVPLSRLVKSWAGNISRVFFDINLDATAPAIYTIPPVLILLVLVSYSFYFLYRQTPINVYLFILTMIGIPFLALVLPDFVLGGLRSTVPRYLIPCFLGLLLTVAYLFSHKIFSSNSLNQKLWLFLFAVVLSAEVVSCVVYSQSEVWWNKKPSDTHVQAASLINQTNHPLVITSYYKTNLGELLSMSYLLNDNVKIQLVSEPSIPNIPKGFSDIFVLNPSQSLKFGIEKEYNYKVEPLTPSELQLWQLKR
ncbi:MAG TPA: glycosyltransferase family 39 protein [Coleofasciculaceae cyanobacterium]